VTSRPTVAVYYWPNFHPDRFHQSKKGAGWTEWEVVKAGKPRFPGHEQPLAPLWGYRDESDPYEMARSIDAMADAGVDALIFDWFRYDDDIDGGVLLESALRDGFLRAENRARVRFGLMWANHTYIDLHPFAPGTKFENAPVWRLGEIGRAAFDRHTQDAIDRYFSQPNYWLIDGRPYFSIYDVEKLIAGLGGIDETIDALESFRARTRAAGFPDLHLNLVDWTIEPAAVGQSAAELVAALGADSTTWYQWVHHCLPSDGTGGDATAGGAVGPVAFETLEDDSEPPTRDYVEWGDEAMQHMAVRRDELGVPFYPHVSIGWDGTPRNYPGGIVTGTSAERFERFLREARELEPAVITINAWNEWVEGSHLEPDAKTGFAMLDAMRHAFGARAPQRVCFRLRVRRERLAEYEARHASVWPEMLDALRATGWRNYSLFLDDDGLLIGYLECDDFERALAEMEKTDVNARWQMEMAPFFEELTGRPDQGMVPLREVFHLT
jgi:L-rhamnose mutarotase